MLMIQRGTPEGQERNPTFGSAALGALYGKWDYSQAL
jgi:hypothetical protein